MFLELSPLLSVLYICCLERFYGSMLLIFAPDVFSDLEFHNFSI